MVIVIYSYQEMIGVHGGEDAGCWTLVTLSSAEFGLAREGGGIILRASRVLAVLHVWVPCLAYCVINS